jgi:hypothetical protein
MPELAALSYHLFSVFLVQDHKGQGNHENSAAFCITLCVTRAARNGQIPDDVR